MPEGVSLVELAVIDPVADVLAHRIVKLDVADVGFVAFAGFVVPSVDRVAVVLLLGGFSDDVVPNGKGAGAGKAVLAAKAAVGFGIEAPIASAVPDVPVVLVAIAAGVVSAPSALGLGLGAGADGLEEM